MQLASIDGRSDQSEEDHSEEKSCQWQFVVENPSNTSRKVDGRGLRRTYKKQNMGLKATHESQDTQLTAAQSIMTPNGSEPSVKGPEQSKGSNTVGLTIEYQITIPALCIQATKNTNIYAFLIWPFKISCGGMTCRSIVQKCHISRQFRTFILVHKIVGPTSLSILYM